MKIGFLSTVSYPLIKYYIKKKIIHKLNEAIFLFDKSDISAKNIRIINARTKNYFNIKGNVLEILKTKKIKFYFVENHNSNECLKLIKKLKLTCLVNCGTPRKIKKKILKSTRFGALNVHPGILPKYRGKTCVEWAIFNNEQVGNTIHLMNENYDDGPILIKEKYIFTKKDDYHTIRIKVYESSINLLMKYLKKLKKNNFKKIKQIKNNNKSGHFYDVIDKKKMNTVKKMLTNNSYKYQV